MMRVRFGRFEFDPETGALLRDGVARPLQPQPARMLAALIARRGEIVTREDLRRVLWADGTHVDYEKGLNFCATQVRAALGDSATSPHYIETLPRRGYRFVAALAVTAEPDVRVDPVTTGRPRVRRFVVFPIAAAVLVLVAATAGLAARAWSARRLPIVAVVPFQNETGVADADRLAKSLSDTTVARLADPDHLARLKVIGNASELRFSFRPPDLKKMGQALGAEFIVLGQLKRDDRSYRVVAHLIRVSDQTHVWATTYDPSGLTLPEQSTLADAIAAAVTSRIGR